MKRNKEQLKSVILLVVQHLRLHPTELLDSMREYKTKDIKEAYLELIADSKLILSSDRYLEIPS